MTKRIYISTGEVSGEQHASRLIAKTSELSASVSFTGMGGDIVRAAGVETIIDTTGRSVMGFAEVVRHLPFFKRAMDTAVDYVADTKPDAVVLVDYPGFHLRLARALKKKAPDVPVIYYIAPKVWAWNESRVEKIRNSVDKLLCIFPFEEKYFEERGVNAEYVGNPTMETLPYDLSKEAMLTQLSVASCNRLVSIFPGSRKRELEKLLPPLVESARRLNDFCDLEFAIAVAPGISRAEMERICEIPDWIRLVEGQSQELIAASDLILAKSGTTTLEAALLGVPMVVVYKTSWLSAAIAKRLVRIPNISLPNIVAERKIVPELLQEDANPDKICSEASMLLAIPERYHRAKASLDELRDKFGMEAASTRTARAVLDYIESR
ncbi:MAG: lipid-A-disaccharide synthase [Planctomycetes bacterium]|nr:lipid-A-disaccharide synthase [Planctomycetota bacterium]